MFRSACLLTLALSATILLGQESPPAKTRPSASEVPSLIKQLGDSSFQVRSAALKELEKLGVDSLPLLRQAQKDVTDPEVQRRLAELIPILERTLALAPTRLTLSVTNRPLREAIQEMNKASGYKLELPSGDDREKRLITVELRDTPFWEAFDNLCDLGGLTHVEAYYGYDPETIRLEYGDSFPGIVHHSGPFRITVRGFDYFRKIDFGTRARQVIEAPLRRTEELAIRLGITVEPKLPLLHCGQPAILDAFDENNHSLLPPAQSNSARYYAGYRSYMQELRANLQPAQSGKTIKMLRGTIPVTVVSAQRPRVSVEKVLEVKNETFKDGNVTMKIDSVTKNAQQVTIKMTLTDGAHNGQRDYTWLNQLNQRLVLTDAKGNRWQCYGPNWDGNGGSSFVGTVTFANNGNASDAFKLTYYEWQTMAHSVAFEFRDLTLP
jgi:hypothetical protein